MGQRVLTSNTSECQSLVDGLNVLWIIETAVFLILSLEPESSSINKCSHQATPETGFAFWVKRKKKSTAAVLLMADVYGGKHEEVGSAWERGCSFCCLAEAMGELTFYFIFLNWYSVFQFEVRFMMKLRRWFCSAEWFDYFSLSQSWLGGHPRFLFISKLSLSLLLIWLPHLGSLVFDEIISYERLQMILNNNLRERIVLGTEQLHHIRGWRKRITSNHNDCCIM